MLECHLYFQQLPTNAQGVLLPLEKYHCLKSIYVERIDTVVEQIYPVFYQVKAFEIFFYKVKDCKECK